MKFGFIGLGQMGSAMATTLLKTQDMMSRCSIGATTSCAPSSSGALMRPPVLPTPTAESWLSPCSPTIQPSLMLR